MRIRTIRLNSISEIMSKIEELPSSDLEDNFGLTNRPPVFIALVDAPVKETDEITVEDTFIGGKPVWLAEDSIPSDDLLKCGACKSKSDMKLLLQAFSPLDPEQVEEVQEKKGFNNMNYVSEDDDRVLYVFLCTKCQRKANSVRCIRGIKKNNQKTTTSQLLSEKMESLAVEKDFKINPFDISGGDNANPFGANPFQKDTSAPNPFSAPTVGKRPEHDSKQEVSAKAVRKLHDSQQDKVFNRAEAFKSYLLYVEEESFKNKKPDHLKLPENLKIDKGALDLSGESEVDLDKNPIKLDPRTEKLSKFLDDDVFQKFQEVVGYNPHQVLRYDFGGKPLLYAQSKVDFEQTVSNPAYNPSSKRVFEMQLMPKMILDLEENTSLSEGMEWGTIMVFTDIENYIPKFDDNGVGYVEESIKVQWESRS